jgi:hypothetical protein
MADINGKFIKPLISLYGELGTDDMDLVIGVYEKQLEGFPDVVLEAGFRLLSGSYMPSKRNPWPSPAHCKKACEKAASEKRATEPPAPEKPKYPEWSGEAIRIADSLIVSDLGRQASRDTGWVLGLHDFCRNHRRLPTEHEIPAIIGGSSFVDRCAAGAESMGTCHKALQKLAITMLDRREKLARRVLGSVA